MLEGRTDDLAVLAVNDVEWSDLGDPARVLALRRGIGRGAAAAL